MADFNFAGFREACTSCDVDRWRSFYAVDAEWLEYRHESPPRAPNVMRGADEIGRFLRAVATSPITMAIENEVVGDRRCAFTLIVTFGSGRRIVENIIIEHRHGKVIRQRRRGLGLNFRSIPPARVSQHWIGREGLRACECAAVDVRRRPSPRLTP